MAIDYTPSMKPYNNVGAFRYWCQTTIPLVYDDSKSYMELLYSVIHYLNSTIKDVANMGENVDALLEAYEQLQGYVNDYFDNLDVQEEINNKLDDLASDGTLSTLLSPYIPDQVTQWLDEHVTPTSPPIDNTLTISGAGADAKVTGDRLSLLRREMINYNVTNLLTGNPAFTFPDFTGYGVTCRYDVEEDCFIINGTANTNGNINIYASSTDFIPGLQAGKPVIFECEKPSDVVVWGAFFAYVNGGYQSISQLTQNATRMQFIVPSEATGMLLRLEVKSGQVYDNTRVYTRLFTTVYTDATKGRLPVVLPQNRIDASPIVNYYLSNYKGVYFAPGEHVIESTVIIPDGCHITGAGLSSIIKPSVNTIDVFRVQAGRCEIDSILIEGLVINIPDNPAGYGCAVRIEPGANQEVRNVKIHDMQIRFFAGGGVVSSGTGYWCACSVDIVNCEIWRCYAGVWFKSLAEYNRVTNCLIYSCYIGFRNDGGNNVIINSSLTENQTAFYITEGATVNNGHGAVVGCTLNHNNSNNGFAVIMRNVQNGFVFSGCNIWYGKIIVSGSAGVMFNGCLIGKGATPQVQGDDNDLLLFSSCVFFESPSVQGTTRAVFDSCRTFTGEVVAA